MAGVSLSRMIRSRLVAALLLLPAACSTGSSATVDQTTTTTTNGPQSTMPLVDTTTTSTTLAPDVDLIEIDLTAPGDDPGRVPVKLGRTVRLVVTAGVTDEIHLHGYDIRAEVAPGVPAVLEFVADIPGIFDVELEAAGDEFMQFQVSP